MQSGQGKVRSRLQSLDRHLHSRLQVTEAELHRLIEYSQGGTNISFTPHGLSHVAAVEANYDWLLSDEDLADFNAAECFCLLIATSMHDSLMIPRRPGMERQARQNHAFGIAEFIINQPSLGMNPHEANSVSEIVKAHAVRDLSDIDESTVLGREWVDLRKLGACLSMADICHADSSRAPQIVFNYLSFDEESARHWRRHMAIGGITRRDDAIELSAVVFSQEGAEAVSTYGDYIREQLELVSPYFRSKLRSISDVHLTIKELASPVEQDLKFTADVAAILNILISGVYESADVFVRELLQNALDATYLRSAIEHRRSASYDPRITVCAYQENSKLRALRVDDNGVGMDVTDIQDTVLLVGGSSANRESVKTLLDSTTQKNLIATFGVGLLSCLKVAKRVTITSRKPGAGGVRVEITGLTDPIKTEESEDTAQGTSVVVELADGSSVLDDPLACVASYCRLVGQVDLRFLVGRWEGPTSLENRAALEQEAVERGVKVPSTRLPGASQGTRVVGEGFSAWLWLKDLPSEAVIGNDYEGDFLVLNDGIFVAENLASDWLPTHLRALSGVINLSAKAVDLPVSRDRVVKNDKLAHMKAELAERARRSIEEIAARSGASPERRRITSLILTRMYRISHPLRKREVVSDSENLVLDVRGESRAVSLRELRDRYLDTVYLTYPAGNYVEALDEIDGRVIYHKEVDVPRLQARVLEASGAIVIECARGSSDNSSLCEADLIRAYFQTTGTSVVDLTTDRPIQGWFRSKPVPRPVRDVIGQNVKFVSIDSLPDRRAWRVGEEIWLNVAHAEVAAVYATLSGPGVTATNILLGRAYIAMLSNEFSRALQILSSGIVA